MLRVLPAAPCVRVVAIRGQDQSDSLALLGADGTEDVGGSGPLVRRGCRATATPRPATGDLVLLADPGFVAEPDLYVAGIDATLASHRRHYHRAIFLKASTAPATWA